MVFGDVTDMESLRRVAFKDPVDVVVSCLASQTGGLSGGGGVGVGGPSRTQWMWQCPAWPAGQVGWEVHASVRTCVCLWVGVGWGGGWLLGSKMYPPCCPFTPAAGHQGMRDVDCQATLSVP